MTQIGLIIVLFNFTIITFIAEKSFFEVTEKNIISYFEYYHDFDIRQYQGKVLIIPNSGCRYCYIYALEALNEERIREDIVILVLGHSEEAIKTRLYQNIYFDRVQNALSYKVSAFTLTLYEFNGHGEYHNFEVSAINFHDIFEQHVLKQNP